MQIVVGVLFHIVVQLIRAHSTAFSGGGTWSLSCGQCGELETWEVLKFDFHEKAFVWYHYCLPSYTDMTADLEFTSPFTRPDSQICGFIRYS